MPFLAPAEGIEQWLVRVTRLPPQPPCINPDLTQTCEFLPPCGHSDLQRSGVLYHRDTGGGE